MEINISFCIIYVVLLGVHMTTVAEYNLINPSLLAMFVDDLPDMPKLKGFSIINGVPKSKSLEIGMFHKKWGENETRTGVKAGIIVGSIEAALYLSCKLELHALDWLKAFNRSEAITALWDNGPVAVTWKFHRDLPPTRVFAFGTSEHTATVPGPTIEALHGVDTYVTWKNHLPRKHILPWDPTLPTATSHKGIPTVVHVHGSIGEPESDGHAAAWFTSGFRDRGPTWSKKKYHYHNNQQPGTLWYHDHALGLTRVNLLAGLIGAYVVRHPDVEAPLRLPSDDEYDRPLIVFDRSFCTDGSIYMNFTGNNPSIHPQWQPEYFGDAIIVNGKAWPCMIVWRRKYRFRIINASNARFFKFFFTNGLKFIHVASDSAYHCRPVVVSEILLAPSEIADVVVDFAKSKSDSVILANDAAYPYPAGDPVNELNGKVMKFVIKKDRVVDTWRVPKTLIKYPSPDLSSALTTRYIAMYEYTTTSNETTHLDINAKTFEAPSTETPKVGATEVWYVINLTGDNHPLHIHLGLFVVLDQTEILKLDEFTTCMNKMNDATKCHVGKYARGKTIRVLEHENGWKNVYKMMPGYVTKILVRFSYIHSNASYSFDATKEPGYVYHCHILDHEDNVMMRPLKMIH